MTRINYLENIPHTDLLLAERLLCFLIQHLLIDLPSVDKEKDEGKLLAHKAFWNVTDVNDLNLDARLEATITEMIYVPDNVADGSYLLNLQIASFENDASPSKPVLYLYLTSDLEEMNLETYYDYCLSKKGVTEHFPLTKML
jgi:hypothetical protein